MSCDLRAAHFFADPFREGVEEFFEGLAATEFQIDMHRTRVSWLSDSQEIRIYQIERYEPKSL